VLLWKNPRKKSSVILSFNIQVSHSSLSIAATYKAVVLACRTFLLDQNQPTSWCRPLGKACCPVSNPYASFCGKNQERSRQSAILSFNIQVVPAFCCNLHPSFMTCWNCTQ
jgi:hypothetical protein